MQTETQYNKITLRGARWLLLFVFYLHFLVSEFVKYGWQRIFISPLPEFVSMIAIQIFAVALPCAVFLYLNTANPTKTLKLNPITRGRAVMCVFIGITAQSVASVLNIPMLLFIEEKIGKYPIPIVDTPKNIAGLLVGLLVVAFLPAVFEELLMRGIVLSATEDKGYRASLIMGGLYFALLHNRVEYIAGHFFLGFLLCYIVWMTESIFGGMIAHFAFNAWGMLLYYLITEKSAQYEWLGSGFFHWGVTLFSVLLFFFFVGTIHRRRVRKNKSHRLFLQLVFSVLNFPVIVIVLGYILFQFIRFIQA
ncbi:MAG: CAAX amino terminal protease self- immunity [Firmicutes bacterium ADurb.Bin193]|nr:MAG: CAAX amino terminal protease self- immunity [Firmicutes bacterium ADurb.Bin193]